MKDRMDDSSARLSRIVDDKFYGKYRAYVSDNLDPENLGRLKLVIPSVLGRGSTDWALPCFPFGGGQGYGWYAVPEKDSWVWAEFEEGDLNRPLWTGVFFVARNDVPEEAIADKPTSMILKTPGGHVLQFNDEKDNESILIRHKSNTEIHIDENGTLLLRDNSGGSLKIDADGGSVTLEDGNDNKIELSSSGITIKGKTVVIDGSEIMLGGNGGEFLLKGESFMNWFNGHVHSSPAGPPAIPMPPSNLSIKVTTR